MIPDASASSTSTGEWDFWGLPIDDTASNGDEQMSDILGASNSTNSTIEDGIKLVVGDAASDEWFSYILMILGWVCHVIQ